MGLVGHFRWMKNMYRCSNNRECRRWDWTDHKHLCRGKVDSAKMQVRIEWSSLTLDWYAAHPSTDPVTKFVGSYRGVGRVFMDHNELRMVFHEIPSAVRV